jgi:predicted glutamine amidotransferase
MCMAIFKPAKIVVKEEHLRNSWIANPDGAGFAYVKGGKVVVEKGYLSVKEFLAAYETAFKKNKNSPFLIHFRIRSMGDRGAVHTHPYMFQHGALIHNGTIHGTGAAYGTGPSDTELFARRFGAMMTFENVTALKDKLEKALDFNKIVILYPSKEAIILNEPKGTWDDGVWFSTTAYQRSRYSSYGGGE